MNISGRKPTETHTVNALHAFAQQIFASQPFSRFIGAELTASSLNSAELTLIIQDHHKQQHGFVHGGVLAYLADNAITFAGGLALGGNALTVEFKINYLRPAVGTRLIARAKAEGTGKRTSVCRCELHVSDGKNEKLCALAQGTVIVAD